MAPLLSVNIIYDKTNTTNFNDDVIVIEKILKKLQDSIGHPIGKPKVVDMREPLSHSDINIHLEVPIFGDMSWAHTNIMMVNPEKWVGAYEAYIHAFDAIILRDSESAEKFRSNFTEKGLRTDNIYVVPLVKDSTNTQFSESCAAFLPALTKIYSSIKERRPSKGIFHCPPVLHQSDCPSITIVTPTYNREKLIEIAFHNLLITDYPQDKIEWIVIEDNEKTPHMASEKIISFQIQVPKIQLKYIPIEGRMSIGEKRNHAIEHASNDIILFMDDDDHYPETSFRRRVAWLTKGTKCGQTGKASIACCTTLALYDLKFGTSAVNVPPFDIPFAKRISEATLTFKKSAWLERKFPNVSIAEGEGWIAGREEQVIEMPPQQIIVAFSHGNNQSSRRIPPSENKPACFWGFPREYLIFVHGLAGVQVEEDKKDSKR